MGPGLIVPDDDPLRDPSPGPFNCRCTIVGMGIRSLTPAQVVTRARNVPAMGAFFAIVGSRIARGDSLTAFRALRDVVDQKTAWRIVEGWQALGSVERLTGWTPEVAAMGVVMEETDAWRRADWSSLSRRWFRD